MTFARRGGWALAVGLGLLAAPWREALNAQHALVDAAPFVPKLAEASEAGERAIRKFQVPAGYQLTLWAAEPDVAQGVALYPDADGRIYVCETFRHSQGVTDIRKVRDWLDEDLACRTVDDRLAMMKRRLGARFPEYGRTSERVRLLWDEAGTGRATRSTVFAEGFRDPLDGIMAGVIARGRDVWVACIPALWQLRDENGDGIADRRRVLQYGYGVRVGFLGHDLHGLTWGPDGRLYFSLGDRGSRVVQNGRTIGRADTGSVFRCMPDGSELEEFAFGLRNPQDLAFDAAGNLFTADNNSDGGDQARWTYLVEGGDSGWRIGWQFLERGNAPNARGPWNSEKMWHPQNDAQPASLVPPIRNITSGPGGLAFYPGTGFPESFDGSFTLVDFRGSSAGSGLWSFKLKPKGASFELVDEQQFLWQILATDAKWGPDGALYVLDWVEGWEQNGRGRIYRLSHPGAGAQPAVAEVRRLLREGMDRRQASDLFRLLGHPNQRVRQEAQFALAARGGSVLGDLQQLAATAPSATARLHALWALWQMALRPAGIGSPSVILDGVIPVLRDREPEVRANAARVLGDARHIRAYEALVGLTSDENLHVRHLAATALGRLGRPEAVPALITLLRENADRDPVLRHAASHALALLGEIDPLVAASRDPSPAVRLGAVLALRRLGRAEIGAFLADADERVLTEAARAVNDEPISGALPALAALIDRESTSEPLLRRVLNAHFRWGTPESADALARYATRPQAPEALRTEAVRMLADWPANPGRDHVTGLWRPTAFQRTAELPATALRPHLANLLKTAPDSTRRAAAEAAGTLGLTEAAGALAEVVREQASTATVRTAAIRALASLKHAGLPGILEVASKDPDPAVRRVAVELAGEGQGGTAGAVAKLGAILEKGSVPEQQAAFRELAKLQDPDADRRLADALTKLLDGTLPLPVRLDLLEAAEASKAPEIRALLTRVQAGWSGDGRNIEPWRICLDGGNPEAGRTIFLERAEVSCLRCHKADGEGGEVGPELNGLVARLGREYVLESILFPNARIAAGFDNILLGLKNGGAYAGVIKKETDAEVTLLSPEDGLVVVKKDEIASREKGLSGMPEGFGMILTKRELRDLLAFLATLK